MPRPIHFEIPSDDIGRARRFYGEAFGWEFSRWGGPMEYWMAKTGPVGTPGIDGGIAPRQPGSALSLTLDVADLGAFSAKVEKTGGTIVVPKMAIAGVGWLVYFSDPDGNVLGMLQADPVAK